MSLTVLILLAGIGTFLMRTAGVWLPEAWVPTRWLAYLPLAVILAMAVASVMGLVSQPSETVATILTTLAVVGGALCKWPLAVCILLGCGVFGMVSSLAW
ncbi:branched-chain amino acid transporter [Thermoleptolyngbya sichuanensis A183]|uniref:Branched-chain amino acid transporter n=1 Tax=Thermoleptolyngbya sichuanensis A183 TaxID=2737172 RepID=A0A6M8BIN0_9CYAN|nr:MULTISPECIES: AzlD domain-containing protein [Thermoleptolyngbya]QKD84296.1 branched-chain amino acid transporter [Thermoleptolyngbya sichuanensis A183]